MENSLKIIKDNIHSKIDEMLDDYLDGRTFGTRHAREVMTKDDFDLYFDGKKKNLKEAKKDFNRNLKKFIIDIRFPGIDLFKRINSELDDIEINKKYSDLIRKILNEIIEDRMAEKDDNLMENVISFNDFGMVNEIKIPILKIDEILDNVSKVKHNTLKNILVTFFKVYVEYIDLIDKTKHIYRINDMSGDVLKNNRVSFDVIIFDQNDFNQIRENIIDYSIGEFYTQLPDSIDVFGIGMKPSSFVDKNELKTVFEGQITIEQTIDIVSGVTGFKYENKFNDFYIWSKK